MEFLQLIANSTQRGTIVSELITDHFQVPPFAQGDLIDGKIVVVRETGDPTAPTAAFVFDAAVQVALTNGKDVIYANAGALLVTGNTLTFELEVGSAALESVMAATDNDYIEGYLEVRIAASGQDGLLLREPVTIEAAATGTGNGSVPPPSIFNKPPITVAEDFHITSANFEIMADSSVGSFKLFLPKATASGLPLHICRMPGPVDNLIEIVPDSSDPDNPDTIQDSSSISLVDDWSNVWLIDAATGFWDNPS